MHRNFHNVTVHRDMMGCSMENAIYYETRPRADYYRKHNYTGWIGRQKLLRCHASHFRLIFFFMLTFMCPPDSGWCVKHPTIKAENKYFSATRLIRTSINDNKNWNIYIDKTLSIVYLRTILVFRRIAILTWSIIIFNSYISEESEANQDEHGLYSYWSKVISLEAKK